MIPYYVYDFVVMLGIFCLLGLIGMLTVLYYEEIELMIFPADHIKQIIARTKTQTRRKSPAYRVGRTYAVQPGRKRRIPDGRIIIMRKREEKYLDGGISVVDALAEGGYTPGQYETLFKNMYPGWIVRYAYTFEFIPSKQYRSTKL